MKRSELFFTALLIPVDAVMLFLAFITAYYLRNSFTLISPEVIGGLSSRIQYNPLSTILPLSNYLHYVLYLIPGMIAIFALSGLYSFKRSATFFQRLTQVAIGVSMGLFFILLLFLFKRDFFLPRTTVLYSWVLGILFVTLGRFLVRMLQRALNRMGIGLVRIAVLGSSSRASEDMIRSLAERRLAKYIVIQEEPGTSVPDILDGINRDVMDELIVMNDRFSIEDLQRLRNRCLEQHVSFGFVPRAFTALHGAAYEIREEAGLPLIEVRPTPLDGWARIVKRIFDIVVSIILIILLSPIYLVIAIAMYLTSPGAPLVIRHQRLGRAGTTIKVSKYRSMRPDWTDQNGKLSPKFQQYLDDHPAAAKEWKETAKLKTDPRVSPIGTFLRATRLDELPQFIDVLRGDLSLVGPRPILDWEVEKFGEQARILFHVRPGITGPWQVEGGNTLPYDERVRLNTYYIEHWSLGMDLIIIVKTGWLVIKGIFFKAIGIKDEAEGY